MDFFKRLEKCGLLFNEKQKEAIMHIDGPLLVAAGPGSGKTSVITARVAYLIQKAKVDPSSIMVITFTRAAANEMKVRFADFPGTSADHTKRVEFGTFHSIFYKIICTYYGRKLTVLDPLKTFNIIKNILKSIHEPYDDDVILNVLNEISIFRTVAERPENFTSQLFLRPRFSYIVDQYDKQKKLLKSIDFDDMMIMCAKILEHDENFLSNCRKKYRYFLVDEFQDTCKMQYELIRLLSHPQNNICVVGDDDQSIYGFRGAMHDCLIRFENHYTPCKSVILDINYRSTEEIVEISRKIINNNTLRKHKDLKSVKGHGEKVAIISPPDEDSEAAFIADSIENMHKDGTLYRNFSILYRTNTQSRPIVDELIRRDIPFNVRDGLINFYDHWICRDLTYYLRLVQNNNDRFSLLQIINRPARYIPRELINNAVQYCDSNVSLFQHIQNSNVLKDFQLQKIRELERNLKSIKHQSPEAAVNSIRKTIGYDDYIKKHCMEYGISPGELFNILEEYEISASGFKSIHEFLYHINEVSQKLKRDDKVRSHADSVTLSTIHGAKGLEFPYVFVIGCIEGYMPHSKCLQTGENVEEERRLLYVAITRAKTNLIISSPLKHHGRAVEPSRFIDEINEVNNKQMSRNQNLIGFRIGEWVNHRIFGTGRIIKTDGKSIDIKFNSKTGIKTLDTKTCIDNKLIDN